MDFSKPLQLSAVGWLWVKYAEDNYNMIRNSIDPAIWASFIKPVLSQKLAIVALLPVYIAVPVMLVMKLFGRSDPESISLFGGGTGKHKNKKENEPSFASTVDLSNKSKKKKIKYNRR